MSVRTFLYGIRKEAEEILKVAVVDAIDCVMPHARKIFQIGL